MTLSSNASEYIRSLNGEYIPMSFPEAQAALAELNGTGLIVERGYIRALSPEGRVVAKKLKREAHGRMPNG